MRTFSISYDLADPARNKHAVATAIMNLGNSWARPLETTWYVRANVPENEICDELAPLLDADDGLIVHAVDEKVALLNTSLRWFRRRESGQDRAAAPNIIAFPVAEQVAA